MKSKLTSCIFVTLLCAILGFRMHVTLSDTSNIENPSDFTDEVKIFLDEQNLNAQTLKILSDDANRLRFYLNYNHIDFLMPLDYSNPGFYLRENRSYISIEDRIKNRHYNMIIILDSSNYSANSLQGLQDLGYNKLKLKTASIFTINLSNNL